MKTTRLRSLVGEEISVPNSDLLSGQIHNYRRMNERSVTFRISLHYLLTADEVNAAKHIIQEVIERQDKARFRYCLFKAFTESSLIVESSYDVLSQRMTDFLMTQDPSACK